MDPLTLKYDMILKGYDYSGMVRRQVLEIDPYKTIAPKRTSRRIDLAKPGGISHGRLSGLCGMAWSGNREPSWLHPNI